MSEKIAQFVVLAIIGASLFLIIGTILVKFFPWIVAGCIVLYILVSFSKGPDKRERR